MKPIVVFIAALGLMAVPALSSPIFVANGDFDAQTLGSNTFALGVTDWPAGAGAGNGAPVVSDQTVTFPTANLPPGGGPNVAILGDFNGGNGYIFQTLATAWAANTTYTLSFYVGHGANLTYEGYLVTLDAGSTDPATAGATLLASDNTAISGIGAGDWALDSLVFTTGAIAPSGDITIELGLTPAGGGTGYDLITLDAVTNSGSVPEPGAWTMVAAGLCLLSVSQRRNIFRR